MEVHVEAEKMQVCTQPSPQLAIDIGIGDGHSAQVIVICLITAAPSYFKYILHLDSRSQYAVCVSSAQNHQTNLRPPLLKSHGSHKYSAEACL